MQFLVNLFCGVRKEKQLETIILLEPRSKAEKIKNTTSKRKTKRLVETTPDPASALAVHSLSS
jgi:hypothetical protein